MMPSNHLILCHPLLLLPSIFPSIRVFRNNSLTLISPSFLHSLALYTLFYLILNTIFGSSELFLKTLMLGKIEGRRRRG